MVLNVLGEILEILKQDLLFAAPTLVSLDLPVPPVFIAASVSPDQQGPVSRTSRNFSGDINPFISSIRTCFKL